MSVNLDFRIPVVFEKDRNIGKFLLEKVDGYFSLGGKRAFVISKNLINNCYEVVLKDYNQSAISKVIFGALKIATYITLVIPALMYFAKLALRAFYSFHLVNSEIKQVALKPITISSSLKDRKIFVFGDIHGELDGFRENLSKAGIVDSSGGWRVGCTSIAIQMGDVIDRGPKSIEAYQYLDRLEEQAESRGGKLKRLLGNHELMLLERNYFYAQQSGISHDQCERLRNQIVEDIQSNKIQLVWTDNTRLYTHAGLRSMIREQLKNEIKSHHDMQPTTREISFDDMSKYMNTLLKSAVARNDFSHAVFQAGRSRGGDATIGGILWEDVDEIIHSAGAREIPQVIAHNPPRNRGDAPIRITDSMRLVNVDAGLCASYGGKRAFVQINRDKLCVHEKRDGSIDDWRTRELNDLIAS